jgi:hypothetical protein
MTNNRRYTFYAVPQVAEYLNGSGLGRLTVSYLKP